MHRYAFSFCLSLLVFSGCTVKVLAPPQEKIDQLSHLLQTYNKGIPLVQTRKLSQDISQKTEALSRAYQLTTPPLWHNTLVNTGFRKKGLCYHWSDSLYRHLKKQNYSGYTFHLMGANVQEYFFEHNALAVVPKGSKIEEGVIIDPWRNSGKLYFDRIKEDPDYVWVHRTDRGCVP